MTMACRTVSSLDYTSPLPHEKSSQCKILLWPPSQRAAPSTLLNWRERSIAVACTPRETLTSQPLNVARGSLEDPSASLQSRENADTLESDSGRLGAPDQALENCSSLQSSSSRQVAGLQGENGSAASLVPVSKDATQVSFQESEPVELRVRDDDDEEERMKGFHGAKGALIKPLSADSLSYFPEGYLDKITSIKRLDWVTLVPTHMLSRGDRLVLDHNKESVILFWFEDRIYAIENRSPAAPMHEEGFSKAVLTEDGLMICPITGSKFDVRTGDAVEWLPNCFFLQRLLTPVLNDLSIYAVKASPEHIFIHKKRLLVGGFYPLAEFTGNRIWTGPDYEEPIIFDDLEFGFTEENELTNGRMAMIGFLSLILFEMTTGEGFLKAFGILDFLYEYLPGFPVLKY